jgi:hypothetical protein
MTVIKSARRDSSNSRDAEGTHATPEKPCMRPLPARIQCWQFACGQYASRSNSSRRMLRRSPRALVETARVLSQLFDRTRPSCRGSEWMFPDLGAQHRGGTREAHPKSVDFMSRWGVSLTVCPSWRHHHAQYVLDRKTLVWCNAGHDLTQQVIVDRQVWMVDQMGINAL